MNYLSTYQSPIGEISIASDGENIIGLWIKDQKYFASTLKKEVKEKELEVFKLAKRWLDSYFSGEEPKVELPLKLEGSEFRQSVWKILCKIPYGKVITYGDIAKQIKKETGKNMSGQAVGGAVGHNPISIIIPCHRVVGSNGSLTGYAGGIDKKIYLLKSEKVDISKYSIPTKEIAI